MKRLVLFAGSILFVPSILHGKAPISSQHATRPLFTAKLVVPFVACGDLQGWDSEKTYQAAEVSAGQGGEGAVSLLPVQPPIAPPYKKALELIKHRRK